MHAVYPHLQLAVSETGVLVYVPGGDVAVAGIAWVDRQGHSEFLPIEPRVYGMLDLSDDGRRLAVQVSDNNDYILIHDVERNSSRRLPTARQRWMAEVVAQRRCPRIYELCRREAVSDRRAIA